jgi:ABC-type glycerol-3-phosphate transport system substrate-binding protein
MRLWLAIVVLVVTSGCARDDGTLTIALGLLPGELAPYRAVLDDYQRQTGERVVVVPQQYADIRRALAAEGAAGSGTLDLVELDVYSLAPAADDVRRLDDADLADLTAALEPATVRAGTIDGLRFLPHRVTWQAMLYDHATLGAPPRTWDELRAVARAHPGRIGFKAARYEGLTCDLLPFVWSAGGDGTRFDDAGARDAFALFAELAPAVNPQSAVFKEATIVEAMARGEIVLHLNWPFAISVLASQGLAPERVRAAPLPAGPRGRATVLGGGYLAIPRHAPHPEKALRLAQYLLSRDVQQRLGRELGWFSPRRDVAVADDPLLAGWRAMRDDLRARPERADYPLLSRAWQEAFRAVVFDGTAPEAALDAAARRVAAAASGGAAATAREGASGG